MEDEQDALLRFAVELALGHLDGVRDRHVGARATHAELRAAFDVDLPDAGEDPTDVLEQLANAAEPGLIASTGPRYFGFVVGGSHPVATAADWLTSAWDQNAGLAALSPASAVAEEVCERWLLDLLGLPAGASIGFVTGAQAANTTALASARDHVLREAGWDVDADGLAGSPPVDVFVGEQAHATIFVALRLLGLGAGRARRVPVDDQGRMLADELARMLRTSTGPTIVCAQAGEVNTGAFDPLDDIADLARESGAWLHVDGAFGLWAAASPQLRHLASGVERADSWATDAHKWLNVPYDSGLAIVARPEAMRRSMGLAGAYLALAPGGERDPSLYVPEASRRARGFVIYATLRALGRRGVAELVERSCRQARRMAAELGAQPGIRLLNEVVLNQVLFALDVPEERALTATAELIERVREDGTCWLGGTTWAGSPAVRVSVSNWSTTSDDISRSAAAIGRAAAALLSSGSDGARSQPRRDPTETSPTGSSHAP